MMVSVSVAVVVVDAMVTDGGAKVQVTCAGSVPQENVTVPVYPPVGVNVIANVPELPLTIVRVLGLKAAEILTATTVSDSTAEVLPVTVPLPAYTAVMGNTPGLLKVVVNVAVPDVSSVPVPSAVAPL